MTSLEQQQQQLWQQQQQQQQVNYNLSTTTTNANVTTSDPPSIATATCAYDPETSPIPDQQAYAILDLYGNIIRSSTSSTSSSSASASSTSSSGGGGDIIKDAPTLYKMIVESTSLVLATSEFEFGQEEEKGSRSGFGLNRMTITFDSAIRYVIARDENHIYLLQTSTTSTITK